MEQQSVRPSTSGGFVCIVLTLIGWSSVPLFLRYFAQYIDAWTANGWRYGMSALVLLPFILYSGWRRTLPAGLFVAALLPSVANSLAQVCFAWAPYYIKPGMQTFLLRLQIVFIAAGAYMLFPAERSVLRNAAYRRGLVLVLLGSMGLLLLGEQIPRGTTARGVVLSLLSGVGFAAYTLAVRYFMHRFHPIHSFAVISLYTAGVMVIIMLIRGENYGAVPFAFDAVQFTMLVLSALAGIAIGHVLYYAALSRLGVATSSGVILLQPVVAATASFFLFNERLTWLQWVGGLVAVGGAGIMVFTQSRITAHPAAGCHQAADQRS